MQFPRRLTVAVCDISRIEVENRHFPLLYSDLRP